jgi:multiple sugar transport system substrate-binding protein
LHHFYNEDTGWRSSLPKLHEPVKGAKSVARKSKSVLVFLLCAVFALAGCSQGSGSNSSSGGSSSSKVDGNSGKQKISVWHYFENNTRAAFETVIKKYNGSQHKYEVVPQYVPFANMKKQLSIGLAAGNDLPDIVQLDNPDHAAFSAMGTFEDITDLVTKWGQIDKFFPGPVNSTKFEGKYYGLPISSNCLALFYNKDLFKQAGVAEPPKTWNELRTTAKQLKKGDQYGLAISAIKSEEGTFQFLPWLLSTGANYDSMNQPEAVKSLEILTNMIKDGSMSKEVINWTQGDVEKQFAAGKAAMMVNGPWNIGQIKTDMPKGNWGVALLPIDKQNASVLGGENIAIVKGKNKEGAWDFISWLLKPENFEEFIKVSGYWPPRKDVAENSDYWKSDPVLKVFSDQMNSAMPRGPHPKWPQISEAIQGAMQRALTLHDSPESAMKEAASKIESLLK